MKLIYVPKRVLRTARGRRAVNELLSAGYFIKIGERPSSRFDRR